MRLCRFWWELFSERCSEPGVPVWVPELAWSCCILAAGWLCCDSDLCFAAVWLITLLCQELIDRWAVFNVIFLSVAGTFKPVWWWWSANILSLLMLISIWIGTLKKSNCCFQAHISSVYCHVTFWRLLKSDFCDLCVCLSRSCIVLKRRRISTWFLVYTVSLSDCVKILLTLVNQFLLDFAPKWPTLCWFEHWQHLMANCGRIVRDSTMITMECVLENTIAVSNDLKMGCQLERDTGMKIITSPVPSRWDKSIPVPFARVAIKLKTVPVPSRTISNRSRPFPSRAV